MTLEERLVGQTSLRKELSYYGAIRCTHQEVMTAIDKNSLLDYEVDVTHNSLGAMYCRATMDSNNQVYASWLCTIAGDSSNRLWSNNRERLGDMVEAALGLLKLIDEKHEIAGKPRWRPKLNEQQDRAICSHVHGC